MVINKIFFCFLLLFSSLISSNVIYHNSIVFFDPNNEINDGRFKRANEYKYYLNNLNDLNSSEISILENNTQFAKFNSLLKAVKNPKLELIAFTDGSIIAKYENSFDYNKFAIDNNIAISKKFTNLNIMVFKTSNFKELQNIVYRLNQNQHVESAKLDLIRIDRIPL